jgi:DNA-binding PadR family transcriptional regulator
MRYPHPVSVEARCLQVLAASPCKAAALAKITGATAPGIYTALRRLGAAGKVRVVNDDGGRAVLYALTARGQKTALRERKLILATCGVAA